MCAEWAHSCISYFVLCKRASSTFVNEKGAVAQTIMTSLLFKAANFRKKYGFLLLDDLHSTKFGYKNNEKGVCENINF